MKFLADMGISPKTVNFLKTHGYEAIHLRSLGLDRLADADILIKALLEDRIILTHDLDFAELVAASGSELPSVIIFRLRNMRPENVNKYVFQITKQYSEELRKGAIVSVTERRARVRKLPIHKNR